MMRTPIIGDRRSSSGSLATLAVTRRGSSRVNSLGLLDGPEFPFKLPFFPEQLAQAATLS